MWAKEPKIRSVARCAEEVLGTEVPTSAPPGTLTHSVLLLTDLGTLLSWGLLSDLFAHVPSM
jgi:hypothetical protein